MTFAGAIEPINDKKVDIYWVATVGYTPFGANFSIKMAIFCPTVLSLLSNQLL